MFGISSNIIASIFILIAVGLLILAIAILIIWMWRGGDGILFPGLGLIVSIPGFVVLLLILGIISVVFAGIIKPKQPSGLSEINQDFEYPDDIFNGCGNGTLDLSLVKDPNNYNEKTDCWLKVCINSDDIEAIQDSVVSGRIKYKSFESFEQSQKDDETNREIHEKFASDYPFIGRINDMYKDYVFSPEEITKLREECLNLRATKPGAAADLALRKFIYACDEALKDNYHLEFSCD